VKVSFADTRPQGAYALALPVWGETMLSDRLSGLDEQARRLAARAAEAQRFEREPAAIAETFYAEGDIARRLLLVGLGGKRDEEHLFERVGGALTAKLLTSGETRLVVDVSGLDLAADAAARIGFGAAARAWRFDKYRTKLSKKQKPTLEEVVIVGAGSGAEDSWSRRSALLDGLFLTRELVTEPANIIYPKASSSGSGRRWTAAASNSRCWTRRRWPSSAWAPCSASARARCARRGCSPCAGTGQGTRAASPSC
jgi:leucyl aminopeptidase